MLVCRERIAMPEFRLEIDMEYADVKCLFLEPFRVVVKAGRAFLDAKLRRLLY